mmetsp:Transcript_75240/g.151267  ORF Transcript_75240/g.151267 Transcript_75240/m.151267 type:complete len:219 (+) Transcript_75240:270-926(+)
MPSLPAMITAVVMPMNRPWSTTPTMFFNSFAARTASLIAVSKCKSTMKLPLSVTAGSVPSTWLFDEEPKRNTGRHPASDGKAPIFRRVWPWQKGVISTGMGNAGPKPLPIFDSSTITMNFLAHTSTIFSRSKAPPPPFTRFSWSSTSSAPSIATSSSDSSSRVTRGMPRDSACSLVRTLVGTAMMSVSSPDLSSIPKRSTANAAVDPVPSPTFMPLRT